MGSDYSQGGLHRGQNDRGGHEIDPEMITEYGIVRMNWADDNRPKN